MIKQIDNIDEYLVFIKKYFPDFILDNNPYEKSFVYIKNNEIVGFISYSIIYERAEINFILTDEKFRRQGIAQEIFNYALIDFKKNKVENVSLEVNINNNEAIKFYLKNNFKKKAIRENYYGNMDAYLMIKDLR